MFVFVCVSVCVWGGDRGGCRKAEMRWRRIKSKSGSREALHSSQGAGGRVNCPWQEASG